MYHPAQNSTPSRSRTKHKITYHKSYRREHMNSLVNLFFIPSLERSLRRNRNKKFNYEGDEHTSKQKPFWPSFLSPWLQ